MEKQRGKKLSSFPEKFCAAHGASSAFTGGSLPALPTCSLQSTGFHVRSSPSFQRRGQVPNYSPSLCPCSNPELQQSPWHASLHPPTCCRAVITGREMFNVHLFLLLFALGKEMQNASQQGDNAVGDTPGRRLSRRQGYRSRHRQHPIFVPKAASALRLHSSRDSGAAFTA